MEYSYERVSRNNYENVYENNYENQQNEDFENFYFTDEEPKEHDINITVEVNSCRNKIMNNCFNVTNYLISTIKETISFVSTFFRIYTHEKEELIPLFDEDEFNKMIRISVYNEENDTVIRSKDIMLNREFDKDDTVYKESIMPKDEIYKEQDDLKQLNIKKIEENFRYPIDYHIKNYYKDTSFNKDLSDEDSVDEPIEEFSNGKEIELQTSIDEDRFYY